MSKLKQASERQTSSQNSKNSGNDDYVSIAIAYAEEAIGDKKGERFGKWIRLAAKRFLDDLKRAQGKSAPFLWSPN